MSPTQQWPPATPAPMPVFAAPEPDPAPPPPPKVPVAMPFGEAGEDELTDKELAEALTAARREKARLGAIARKRAGKPVRGPDKPPRQPLRDRGEVAQAARELITKGEAVSVAGLMKSQGCGHTVAVQAMAVLEAEGLVERGGDGKWHVR